MIKKVFKEEKINQKASEKNLQNEIKEEKKKEMLEKEEKKKGFFSSIPAGIQSKKEQFKKKFTETTYNFIHSKVGKLSDHHVNSWCEKLFKEQAKNFSHLNLPILHLIRLPFVFHIFLKITGVKV